MVIRTASVLLCVLLVGSAPSAESFDGRIECVLQGALIQQPDRPLAEQDAKDLTISARCDDGKWSGLWGHALTFNKGQHRGAVRQARWEGDELVLDCAVLIAPDPWIAGGAGTYQLRLRRQADRLTGTYTGTYAYGPDGPVTLQGRVTGRIDSGAIGGRDLAAIGRDEHPRLLLGREDLADLRAKLATPFGQAVERRLAASEHPVGLGLLYQLSGDAAYARRAAAGVRRVMEEKAGGAFAIGRVWGYRCETVAYAYDLCRSGWDADTRSEVESWIDWIAPRCIDRPWSLSSAVNITPGSNYMAVIWAGAGLASLARLGETAPPPLAPREDFATARRIPPPQDWTPGRGVPTNDFVPRAMPTAWLWAGSWPTRSMGAADPLTGLGAAATAHQAIAEGATIALANAEQTFRPLPAEQLYRCSIGKFTENFALDLAKTYVPPGGEKADSYFRTGYFFTALEVTDEQSVRVVAPETACRFDGIWLSGQRLAHGDLCTLLPGTHPLLLRVQSLDLIPNPWGAMLCEPRFESLDPEALDRLVAGREIELAVRQELHRLDLADHAASGGDLGRLQLARRAAHWNDLNCRGAMGDGGFQAEGEGYTQECLRPLLGYAATWRRITGRDLNGRPDASHFAPRYLATTIWPGGSHKGRPRAINQTWGGGSGTLHADYLGRAWPLCPPDWREELLWFWHQRTGATGGTREQQALQAIAGWPPDIDLVYAFLHYPLELAARSPEQTGFPRFWAADGKGFFSFRNGFVGAEDIVVQCYAKDGEGAGWNAAEAGGFQIHGLGQSWARKALHDRGGERWAENVVQLPDLLTRDGARCPVLFRDGDPATGSGSVTVDLTPVYQVGEPHPTKKNKTVWRDAGIQGRRSLAVDFHPATGAAAAILIADQITGSATPKVWTMHLPADLTVEFQADRQRFVISDGTASCVGTWSGPADLEILPLQPDQDDPIRKQWRKLKTPMQSIRLASAAENFHLTVVLTLQQAGAAPAATINAAGQVTIGGRSGSLSEAGHWQLGPAR